MRPTVFGARATAPTPLKAAAGPAESVPQTQQVAQTQAPAPRAGGFDQQMLQRIEETRRRHSGLRDIRARAQGDVERLTAEVAAARAAIKQNYGVDSLDQLRSLVTSQRASVTSEVEAYEASVRDVEAALRGLGEVA